jgi:hypothetical protein
MARSHLHDPAVRRSIEDRVKGLTPHARPRWGKMSVDQMLWHVNSALASALGELEVPRQKTPLPAPLMKFLVLNLPWPKGAPTHPSFVPTASYDFAAEQQRCLRLIDTFGARPLDSAWPRNPIFGIIPGIDTSRLQAKHLDHHLRQFGV